MSVKLFVDGRWVKATCLVEVKDSAVVSTHLFSSKEESDKFIDENDYSEVNVADFEEGTPLDVGWVTITTGDKEVTKKFIDLVEKLS